MSYTSKNKNYVWVLFTIFFAFIQCKKENPRWELNFFDEFSGPSLNTNVWRTNFPWGQQLSGTDQAFLIDSAFTFEDGILKIKSSNDTVTGWAYDEHWNPVPKTYYYTTGMIQSAYSFAQQYGYFETRCKLPFGKGLGFAFWLMAYSGWPPEIDICEFHCIEPDRIHLANHFRNIDGIHTQINTTIDGLDFTNDFHIYAIEWNPKEIIWYIDNKQVFISETAVPQERMYVILSSGVGGSSFTGYADQTTPLPAYFEIDYVRVYKEVN